MELLIYLLELSAGLTTFRQILFWVQKLAEGRILEIQMKRDGGGNVLGSH